MLVLTRSISEKIIINNDIEVCILNVRGNEVRVGITAPSDVAIDRQEIHEIKNNKKDSLK